MSSLRESVDQFCEIFVGASVAPILFVLSLWAVIGSSVNWYYVEQDVISYVEKVAPVIQKMVAVKSNVVDPVNEGKIVHIISTLTRDDAIVDNEFGVVVPNALQLHRRVETLQWIEKRHVKFIGSKSYENFTYKKEWASNLISSDSYVVGCHINPKSHRVSERKWEAEVYKLGEFELFKDLGDEIVHEVPVQPVSLSKDSKVCIQALPILVLPSGKAYLGEGTPERPRIGDTKVEYTVVKMPVVSCYGRQQGKTIVPYEIDASSKVFSFRFGSWPLEKMLMVDFGDQQSKKWRSRGILLLGFIFGGFCFYQSRNWDQANAK